MDGERPDWRGAFAGREDREFGLVVLDNDTGVAPGAINGFDYDALSRRTAHTTMSSSGAKSGAKRASAPSFACWKPCEGSNDLRSIHPGYESMSGADGRLTGTRTNPHPHR